MSDVIRMDGVTFRYGRHVALDNVSLAVPEGTICALIGENGAGKTTTFGVLTGGLRPRAGSASVLGLAPTALHRQPGAVGIMPQDAAFPGSVPIFEELEHYARLQGADGNTARRVAGEALERVGLSESAGKKGAQLSHGMRKRVAFAQATLLEPRVVFLDEPTNGLDPRHARQVKDLIVGLAPRATVLISSHQLVDLQELCSHAFFIHQGRLIRSESLDAITGRDAEFRVLLEAAPPEALHTALAGHFGPDNLWLDGQALVIRHGNAFSAADAVRDTVLALLEHDVPFVEIHRGASLEASFLASTAGGQSV